MLLQLGRLVTMHVTADKCQLSKKKWECIVLRRAMVQEELDGQAAGAANDVWCILDQSSARLLVNADWALSFKGPCRDGTATS